MRINEIILEYKNYTSKDYEDVPFDPGVNPKWFADKDNPHIGPHEGKEINLMLHGKKPAALLGGRVYKDIQQYIDAGKLVSIGELISSWDGSKSYIVSTPDGQTRGRKLLQLFPAMWAAREAGDEKTARKLDAYIGLALGYPVDSVRQYLKNLPK